MIIIVGYFWFYRKEQLGKWRPLEGTLSVSDSFSRSPTLSFTSFAFVHVVAFATPPLKTAFTSFITQGLYGLDSLNYCCALLRSTHSYLHVQLVSLLEGL